MYYNLTSIFLDDIIYKLIKNLCRQHPSSTPLSRGDMKPYSLAFPCMLATSLVLPSMFSKNAIYPKPLVSMQPKTIASIPLSRTDSYFWWWSKPEYIYPLFLVWNQNCCQFPEKNSRSIFQRLWCWKEKLSCCPLPQIIQSSTVGDNEKISGSITGR